MRSNLFELMTIFARVVESGSFTKAADTLQLHRPMISKAIQQLEDELGVKLLHRTTRSLSMTEEGEEVYQRSKWVLADINDMMAAFSPTQPPRGRLRIDAPLALAHTVLIPALAEFQALYPEIELILSASDSLTNMVGEGIDCVIRLGELEDSSVVSRRVGHVRMVTCATPSYLAQFGTPLTPGDLTSHKAVNFFSEHSREVMEWNFAPDGKIVAYRPRSNILVNNSDVLLSCGLAGMGILHAVRAALQPHIQSGKLTEILAEYATVTKPVSVLYPDRRHLPPKVRVFIDWFSTLLTKQENL